MHDDGTHLTVDESEATMADLLKAVRIEGRTVRILSHGEVVAEMTPIKPRRKLPPVDPALRVTFAGGFDPTEDLMDDEWPGDRQ